MMSNFRFLGVDDEATAKERLKGFYTVWKFPLINYACWASSRFEHMYFRIGHCW